MSIFIRVIIGSLVIVGALVGIGIYQDNNLPDKQIERKCIKNNDTGTKWIAYHCASRDYYVLRSTN